MKFSIYYRGFLFRGCLHNETKKYFLINSNVSDLWNWVEAKNASTYLSKFASFVVPYQFVLIWVFDFSKLSVTFENTYVLSRWFHCVDIFFAIINSVTRILLIETPYEFRNIKCWSTLYLHIYIFWRFCISRLAFMRFTFHKYLHCSG